MKRKLKILGIAFLLVSFVTTACFADSNLVVESVDEVTPTLKYIEIVTEEINLNMPMQIDAKSNAILYHNNGLPMKSDYISSTDPNDNLIAVYRTEINGVDHETVYFTDAESVSKESMTQKITASVNKLVANKITENMFNSRISYNQYSRQTIWEITSNNGLEATVISGTDFFRNPNSDYDGQPASAWVANTQTSYITENAMRLNSITTNMMVSYGGEKLIKYSPTGDYSGTQITGTLSYGGLPTVDISFAVGGFELINQTRPQNNYASWLYDSNVGTNTNLVYSSAIGASNTTGNFTMGLGHVIDLYCFDGSNENTGKGTTYVFADR